MQGIRLSVGVKMISMMRLIGLILFAVTAPAGIIHADMVPDNYQARSHLAGQFQKYRAIGNSPMNSSVLESWPSEPGPCPGWGIGVAESGNDKNTCETWRYRRTTYEFIFPSRLSIARAVYQLALFTGDLDSSISMLRFEKGAQGFHYSLTQITEWANNHAADRFLDASRHEDALLICLILDGVVKRSDGIFYDTGRVKHVLGASPGITRSLALNLNHERLHVLWDEDLKFRATYVSRWEALTRNEQKAVYETLSGYGLDNEMGIIEEWAVRQCEADSIW